MKGIVLTGPVGTFTWRMLATVMAGQAIALFFGALVARGLAEARGEAASTAYLVVGSGLAVACLVAAGLMRGRWGVLLGWLVHAATLLSALVLPMMVLVFLIFAALWVGCLVKGHDVDAMMARRAAEAGAAGG